jgi:hypothetical protein
MIDLLFMLLTSHRRRIPNGGRRSVANGAVSLFTINGMWLYNGGRIFNIERAGACAGECETMLLKEAG